jgi:hypothetical protein
VIFKELDPFRSEDKFEVAGRKAEEQMAHYLRRFFGSSPDVDVLNYLRIDLGGEVAQIDHLVLHPYGLLIVESKSVAGSVQIKEDGQWIRWFNKQPKGMRSPVTQAKMQLMLLKELLDRTVKQKGFFDQVRMDVLVAISDAGTIQWPPSGALPEVCKADQVPDRVIQRVDQFRKIRQAPDLLAPEHRRVIGEFLKRVHKPLDRAAADNETKPARPTGDAIATKPPTSVQPEAVKPAAEVLPSKFCKHCGAPALEIRHGQFGYYFFCKDCLKNTAIKFRCPSCKGEGKVRKQGQDFFAECKTCAASKLFHTNSI